MKRHMEKMPISEDVMPQAPWSVEKSPAEQKLEWIVRDKHGDTVCKCISKLVAQAVATVAE